MGVEETQVAWGHDGRSYRRIRLPPCDSELLPGIRWGKVEEFYTPSFWKYQCLVRRLSGCHHSHRLGRSLLEEVAACLLGGHGIPAELGLAAFARLRSRQLLSGAASARAIEAALSDPFNISGRPRKYRFVRKKAKYLSAILEEITHSPPPRQPQDLRKYLTSLAGIGPKTASWIVRNHSASNEVAILDVHIIRAGQLLHLFRRTDDPSRNYYELEERFLCFSQALDELPSHLDAVIWDCMRRLRATVPRIAIPAKGVDPSNDRTRPN